MYSCHKNSYLQGNFKDIKASILNRSVQKAFDYLSIDEHDFNPPFNRLTSEQPCIPIENIDPTRRPEGFGRWAMPKLRRELHDKDHQVILAALTSICDLVHNPEKCFEAVRLKIVDRLVDLVTHEMPAIRERAAGVLAEIGNIGTGKDAIIKNKLLLDNLLDRIEDTYPEVRIQVAACLEAVSRFWCHADILVDAGFIQVLLSNLSDQAEIVEFHLETLKNLLHCEGKKIAIEEDGFQALVKQFERDERDILAKVCQIVTSLCALPEGRKLAQQHNLLPELNRLLHDQRYDVHTAAAEAIMFCTIISAEKIVAATIKTMPKRLIQLSKNKLTPVTQMFCIQSLTCICEHPAVRKKVSEKYYKDVEEIQISEQLPEIKNYKNILMSMLQWVPHSKETN